jgi:signal transduction histidine kinase/ligand-binding sensor domain-containing protein/DNA-binding response OmpR family regulator
LRAYQTYYFLRFTFICILLLQFNYSGTSQVVKDKHILKINTTQGLSHNIIYDIVQDKNGFIWIATQDGLNKFDGYEFRKFRFNANDSNSISGNYIKSLFVDKSDRLWISSRYGLNLFDQHTEQFIHFTLQDDHELDITKVTSSSDGGLWVSNYAGGFHYFDIETRQFTSFNTANLPIGSNFVMTIIEDSYNFVWIGTEDYGVQVFKNHDGELIPAIKLNNRLDNLNISRTEVLFEDINSNIWIGTRMGIVFYNRLLDELFLIKSTQSLYGLSGNIILDISQDYEGNILIGTQEGGLDILSRDQIKANNPESFQFRKISFGSEDYQLSYRSVQSIFEDRDKNLWLGTFGNGINLIPHEQPRFRRIKHNPQNPSSINFNKVWGICEDQKGNLWIGTDGQGLNKYDFSTGVAKHYKCGNELGSLSDDAVLSALCDSKGRLWFGTYAGGLNLYVAATDNFQVFDLASIDAVGTNDIRCIYESKSGLIWLGTNGGGLIKLNPDNLTFESILPEADGIGAFDIRSIAEDKEGGLWLGTYGVGLFYYHPERKIVKHFKYDRINGGRLKCNIIYSLLYDQDSEKLWIGGSQSGGLNLLDLKKYLFSVYDEKYGLTNLNIHGIEKDGQGRIWVSTNGGISVFDPETEKFSNYDKLDGVQSKEFADGSVLKSKIHNIICFGGSDGLNYFWPEQIIDSNEDIPLLITGFNIHNKSTTINNQEKGKTELAAMDWKDDQVILHHKENNFTIEFAGLYYSNPQKIKYQYMLEGTDADWNNLGTQRSVTFRDLRAGDYSFKVRASNGDGIWPQSSKSLDIVVYPPPWKSWWAITLYSILALGLVTWIYFYNLKEAKIRHNLVLEKKLRAQEHDLHEERIRFFTNISHELRTPLMLLLNPLEDLVLKESPHTSRGKIFNTMYRSANKLLNLINTLLEFRKTETGKLKLSISKGNMASFVEEICIAFQELASKKNITLDFRSEINDTENWFDSEKLEMILNNLLTNAIKNTPAGGSVKVSLLLTEDTDTQKSVMEISIKDTGVGIPTEHIEKIFDRFYQVKGASVDTGTGIGLALTKRLIALHKGKITVKSKVQEGTEFIIELPQGKENYTDEEITSKTTKNNISSTIQELEDSDTNYSDALSKVVSLSEEKQKILVVEDNAEIRNYLTDLLHKHFIVTEAQDGEQGLKIARKEHPDLILSDIMMPNMNGVDFCKTVKGEFQTSHIPVILITANQTHKIHIDSLEVGADAYLTKPFKLDVLITRIYNLLKSRKKLKEYYLNKFNGKTNGQETSLTKDEEFLLAVKRILNENMVNTDFSITTLHEELGMSRTVFYNKIKSLTSLSPIDLVRQIRLKRAAELLVTGKYKVYEVMFQVGFSDEKHFRHLFKKQFNMTPTQYISYES